MATIQTTLGAGSTASPYFFDVRITKQLCKKTPNAPIFIPQFTLMSYKSVGTSEYEAIVLVQGIVTYTPCGECCAKSQTISEMFVLPFYSTAEPSVVSVAGGTPTNTLVTNGCASCCSNVFICDVPLNLTVTTA